MPDARGPLILMNEADQRTWSIPAGGQISIGRTPPSDIVLKDMTLSRTHLVIQEKDGAAVVVDTPGVSAPYRLQEQLRPGDPLPVGARIWLGNQRLLLLSREWLYEPLPGDLPAEPYPSAVEMGAALGRWIAPDAETKAPDESLWCSLYVQWRDDVIRTAMTDEPVQPSYGWTIDELRQMAGPTVLRWVGEKLQTREDSRWFFGQSPALIDALAEANDPTGLLLVADLAVRSTSEYQLDAKRALKRATARAETAKILLESVPPDRDDLADLVGAAFQVAALDTTKWTSREFLALLERPSIAEAARSVVFALTRENWLQATFRPDDGEFVTLNGTVRPLTADRIRVATAFDVDGHNGDGDGSKAWELHLAEHELINPFDQW